jgi:DNA-binding beta-propeller fold protein YncE
LLDQNVIYATHYFVPELFQNSLQPGELVALDRQTLEPIKRVTVGKSPHAIDLHRASKRLYVVNYQDISVTVVDAETFTVLKTITFPGFGLITVVVSQKYNRIFVTQPAQKRIIVIDGQTLTELPSMTNLPMVSEVVVDEATDRLYALVNNTANQTQQDLIEFAISDSGQQELRRTSIDSQVSVSSEMAVDANRLYVINKDPLIAGDQNHQKLTVLDRQTLTVIGNIPLKSRAGLGVATCLSQHIVYVTSQYHILVIDAHSLEVLRTIKLTEYQAEAYQPKGSVVVDPHTGIAYFSGAGSSNLVRYGVPLVNLGQ